MHHVLSPYSFYNKVCNFYQLSLFPTTQPLAATFLLSGYELNFFFFFFNRNDTMQYLVIFSLVSLMPPSSFTHSEILCISVCIYVCVCIHIYLYHVFLIHWFVDSPVGSIAMNIGVQIPLLNIFF